MSFTTLEPAIDPANRLTFLLDWELTMKCNLDCTYCESGLYGGHDNSTRHPALAECLSAIDFMFEYVNLYMNHRPGAFRHVVINVYGGESLYHPDIVEILEAVRDKHQPYKSTWSLTVTTTTNGIISDNKFKQIIPLIDNFTMSYHTEAQDKQKLQFKQNLLAVKNSGKQQKCIVVMHSRPELFEDAQRMISWLNENNIAVLPRQLDQNIVNEKFSYQPQQVIWFEKLYNQKKFFADDISLPKENQRTALIEVGRACCGGRQVCQDQHYKSRHFFVDNKFPDWYCSVNHFFLFVKQVTREIFVNKDCKMNFAGTVGPIGTLEHGRDLLENLKTQLETNTLPVIQCKKQKCFCGLCAPKAKTQDHYNSIMKKYYQ